MSWMWEEDATATNDKRDGDVFRMQSVPSVQKGGARTTYHRTTCFTVCLGESGNANRRRISKFGGELQHVERPNRVTTRTGVPAGATPVSFVFWNHGSESSQSNRLDVSGSTTEDHGVQRSQNAAGHDAEGMSNTESLQCVRLWNHKAAAILVSSVYLLDF